MRNRRYYACALLALALLFLAAVLADGADPKDPQIVTPPAGSAAATEAPSPTPAPSPSPTASPTPKPTQSLTAKPTAAPTPTPTAKPTAKPTEKPTPTAKPTAKPTPKPTAKPTPKPTAAGNTSSKNQNSKKKLVALTFDDGPSAATGRILKTLDKADSVATFFMVGDRVSDYPEVAKKVAAQGNQIGTHSWAHESLTGLDASALREDLKKSLDRIESVTGVRPDALRPPYGNVNANVKKICGKLGLVAVNWSVDTLDWKTRSADSVYRQIMKHVCDGAIILCHDLYGTTAEAMERAIPELIRKGYRLVTVSELLDARDPGWHAGELYFGAMTD